MREQPEIYDLKFLKSFFRRRKKIFFAVSSVIFTASVLFVIFSPKTYVSTATFLVEGQMSEEIIKGLSSGFIEDRLQSITQQILRRDRLLEIIHQYNLYDKPQDKVNEENAIKKMREDIIVRTIKAEDLDKRPSPSRFNTVAFTLSYQGKDPETVQKVASRLASLYIEKNEQAKEQYVAQTTSVLQQRLNQLKDQTETLGSRLSAFKRQHAGELPESISFNLEQIYRLNAQLEELNNKINLLESRGTSTAGTLGSLGASGSAGATPSANDPWAHLSQLRMQLLNLRAKYSEKHPDVIKTRNEIQQMEEKLGIANNREGATSNPGDTELKRYKKQREDIQKKIAEFNRKNQIAPLLQTEYNRLSADYDGAVKQYNDTKMKLADANVVKKMDESQMGERFIVIDQPVVPQKPDKPKPLKILLAGFFMSIFLGFFTSIISENLDPSIKSSEQLKKITKVPVLTILPYVMSDDEKEAAAKKTWGMKRWSNWKQKATNGAKKAAIDTKQK